MGLEVEHRFECTVVVIHEHAGHTLDGAVAHDGGDAASDFLDVGGGDAGGGEEETVDKRGEGGDGAAATDVGFVGVDGGHEHFVGGSGVAGAAGKFEEEGVGDVRHDEPEDARFTVGSGPYFEVLVVAEFYGGAPDLLCCFEAHPVRAGEGAGHSGGRNSGALCNVVNCNVHVSTLGPWRCLRLVFHPLP